MFVRVIVPNVIIYRIYHGVSNSGFGDAMLKSRRIELNGNIHGFTITNFQAKVNGNSNSPFMIFLELLLNIL
jgi:hypothetical protein